MLVQLPKFSFLQAYDCASRWVIRRPLMYVAWVCLWCVVQLSALMGLYQWSMHQYAVDQVPNQFPMVVELSEVDNAFNQWVASPEGVSEVLLHDGKEALSWLQREYEWDDLNDFVDVSHLPVRYEIGFNERMTESKLNRLLAGVSSYQPLKMAVNQTGWHGQLLTLQSGAQWFYVSGGVWVLAVLAAAILLVVNQLDLSGELPVWRHLQLQAISRRLTLGLYASFVWVLAALVAWCVFYACVYGLSVDELLVGAVFYWGFAVVTVVQLLVLLGVISLARVK